MLRIGSPIRLTQKAISGGLYPEPCNHLMVAASDEYRPQCYTKNVIDAICLDGKMRTIEVQDINRRHPDCPHRCCDGHDHPSSPSVDICCEDLCGCNICHPRS